MFCCVDAFYQSTFSSSGIQTKTIVDVLQHGLDVVCLKGNLEGIPVEMLQGWLFIARTLLANS
jgi:hypothetical protein